MVEVAHGDGETVDVPGEQLDGGLPQNPILNLVWGERELSVTLEGRKACIVRSAHSGDRYMLVELEDGVAESILDQKGIVPNGNHDFSLRAFGVGLTTHLVEDYPSEAEMIDAMEAQGRLNAEFETQVVDLIEDPVERAAYMRSERHQTLAQDLMYEPEIVTGETDGIRWFYIADENFRARGAIEVPTHALYDVLPYETNDLGTVFTRVPGGGHACRLDYGVNPDVPDGHDAHDRIEAETTTIASIFANRMYAVENRLGTDNTDLTIDSSGS